VFVGRGLEEVVEADVIQGCAGSEAGDHGNVKSVRDNR
jgi:hypothetical protein